LKVDNKEVTSIDDLRKALENAKGSVKIEGIIPVTKAYIRS